MPAGRGAAAELLARLIRDRLTLTGAVILLLLAALAALVPFLSPIDPTATSLPDRLLPPVWMPRGTPAHLLGTDGLGRDVLIRIVYGGRISLTVGFGAALIAAGLGVPLGLCSGYFGGALDAVIMRLVDIQLGFPSILLYISALAVVKPGLFNMVAILGVAGWVIHARVVRAQVLSQRRTEYVEAARALGSSHLWILGRHILPNVLAPVVVISTYSIAVFIITASSLSFLGLGLPPSTPDWGQMIATSMDYIRRAWWPSTFAGLALSLTVFGVSVLGDWLRDYLDPRLRVET
ncbi:MAG TPA: ABC transporter permease [bacterium]|nr:ABC transporter permease [bacterium]